MKAKADAPSDSIVVTKEEEGERLDKLLALRYVEQSRSYFQHLIENQLVLLNGAPVKKRVKPVCGDEIEIEFALTPELSLKPEAIPLDILYEDDDLLVINKPAGMVVHPAPGNWTGTFVNALLHHCKQLEVGETLRPGIVHRLDKGTTGVLVAAKTQMAHQKLVAAFAERKVYKEYLAICVGHPPLQGSVETPIGRHPIDRKRMCIPSSGGKLAQTSYQTLAHAGDLSVVALRIHTGRTHQIRVHLRHIKAPLLGDPVYGSTSANARFKVKRPMLHALRVQFNHPRTGALVDLTAPLPPDFIKAASPILSASKVPIQRLQDRETIPQKN